MKALYIFEMMDTMTNVSFRFSDGRNVGRQSFKINQVRILRLVIWVCKWLLERCS